MLIISMLAFSAVIALVAAVWSWRNAEKLPANRRVPVQIVAAVSLAVALGCGALIAFIGTTHATEYSVAVSQVLESRYGVSPLDRESVTSGTAFKAVIDGRQGDCTVAVPDIVVCDGVRIKSS